MSSSVTSVSPIKSLPDLSTLMVTGSLLVCSCWPLVSGSSIGTPKVSIGAVTMKMMSSTSITSTNGVTLISCIGACLRARLRRPPPGRCGVGMLAAMGSDPSRVVTWKLPYLCGEVV